MTLGKGNVVVMLNCLLIGCAILHANGGVLQKKDVQGSTSNASSSPASADAQRIAVLESRIATQENLMTSLTTLMNLFSNRQLEQQTAMSELENLVEDTQDDVTAKQTQVNTAIAGFRDDVTAIRSQVGSLNTALAAKRCEQGRESFRPMDLPTLPDGSTRKHTKHITFNRRFSSNPVITLGFTRLDAERDRNLRVWSEESNVTPSGFDLCASEWNNSIIYEVWVNWMACS